MKNAYISILVVLLLMNFALNAQEAEEAYPATSEEITIVVGNDSIAAFAMLAAGKQKKETVLLLHGLPGNERSLDLAQELRRDGRNVVYFNYRGAWGSQGEFMYSHCLEDVVAVMDFFSSPEHSEKYRIKPNAFILFGHSLGGGIALLVGATDKRVKKIAMFSPNPIGTAPQELLDWVYEYTKTLFMLNVNADQWYQDLIDNKELYNPLRYKAELATKNILILDENLRNKHWVEQLEDVEYILMKTDHSFSDKRLELIEKVKEWIDR